MARKGMTPLNEQWTEFIQGGVSIVVASRDPGNAPTLARGVGCRASPDRTVTVLVWPAQAGPLLDAIAATGAIAVGFSQPSTHQSIQVKGADAHRIPVGADDADLVRRYADAFVADTVPLGYPEHLIRALLECDSEDLAAVRFTPAAAFLQTPGPRAGELLR